MKKVLLFALLSIAFCGCKKDADENTRTFYVKPASEEWKRADAIAAYLFNVSPKEVDVVRTERTIEAGIITYADGTSEEYRYSTKKYVPAQTGEGSWTFDRVNDGEYLAVAVKFYKELSTDPIVAPYLHNMMFVKVLTVNSGINGKTELLQYVPYP